MYDALIVLPLITGWAAAKVPADSKTPVVAPWVLDALGPNVIAIPCTVPLFVKTKLTGVIAAAPDDAAPNVTVGLFPLYSGALVESASSHPA